MAKWCTVTTLDGDGQRYSLDVKAESSFDAAHLYVAHVKGHPTCGYPIPCPETTFEVVAEGRLLRVDGHRLKMWILKRRSELKGPKGALFSQRPAL